ncbi:OLC1v1023814C1 [Oldenlandia corymbosa var. corymbosa]|uniref:OLC1v1023814C1 n=1 Tax=Oldenlandia corymbosa var. corymbosa TaxID=529605 RepID=A0AAV1C4E4_OLDCO|nr:OLC1v1023814C1 [Oldenlandia corymbosa var. corymbosa]
MIMMSRDGNRDRGRRNRGPVIEEKLLELKLHLSEPTCPSPSLTLSPPEILIGLPSSPLFLLNFLKNFIAKLKAHKSVCWVFYETTKRKTEINYYIMAARASCPDLRSDSNGFVSHALSAVEERN